MIKKLLRFLQNLDKRIKFLLVGGLNTVVGVGTEFLVYWLFGIPFRLTEKVIAPFYVIVTASVISQVVGVTHSYLWNKFYTFQSKGKSFREVLRFVSVYAITFVLNLLLKSALHSWLHINIYVVVILTTLITMIGSYIGHNWFSFRTAKQSKATSDTLTEKNEPENTDAAN